MKKPGRRSSSDLMVTPEYPPFVLAPVLRPPDSLAPDELVVWRVTVTPLPRGWFTPDQVPLLESYCVHTATARRLRALLRDLATDNDVRRVAIPLEQARKESALVLRFATALRLTVQIRAYPVTAGRRAAEAVPIRDVRDLLEDRHGNE